METTTEPAAATAVVNSIEVQIDNFLEHFKRTSRAMDESHGAPTEGSGNGSRSGSSCGGGVVAVAVEPPLVPPRRRINSRGQRDSSSCSGSRPSSMGVFETAAAAVALTTEGYDCLHDSDGLMLDSNAEGQ